MIPQCSSGERGQGMVEYAVILFMVTLVVVGILSIMHDRIGFTFSELTRVLP